MNDLEKKYKYLEEETKKIVPAILIHLKSLLKIEESYKCKHKKAIIEIRNTILKVERIEDSIKYQIKLLNELKEIGIIRNSIVELKIKGDEE